jgi:hypothetical protein
MFPQRTLITHCINTFSAPCLFQATSAWNPYTESRTMDLPIVWCNKCVYIKFARVIVRVLEVTNVSACSMHKVCLFNCQYHNIWQLKLYRTWNAWLKNWSLVLNRTSSIFTSYNTTFRTLATCFRKVVLGGVTKEKVLKYVSDKTYVRYSSKIHVIQLRLRMYSFFM